MSFTDAFQRRTFLQGAACALALPLVGCGVSAKPRLVAGLLDGSASISPADWNSYQTSFRNLIYSLEPSEEAEAADRLVVAPISDAPLSQLNTLVSDTITYEGTPDRPQQIERKRQELLGKIAALKPQVRSSETRIIDSLAGLAELLAADEARTPQIMICSDMLEDSPFARFERAVPTERSTREILTRLKSAGLLPDFRGAEVYATGGGGRDGIMYEAVKRFWQAYFAAAKARLVRYTRAPLEFPTGATS